MSKKTKAGMPGGKRKIDLKMLGRVMKLLFRSYPVMVPLTCFFILAEAVVATVPAVFTQKVLAIIKAYKDAGNTDWLSAKEEIMPLIFILVSLYAMSFLFITLHTQFMAHITQGFLCKMRRKMFDGMQNLPIRYFDTHKHGDIMSYYTNDIDTLRQLISQSLPNLLKSGMIVAAVVVIMMWYSIWMTLVILVGVVFMILVSGKIGGGSAKYFIRQQKAIARTEGYVQEMMNGQKVIKVFCHERRIEEEFDEINEELFEVSYRAHAYANMLGPIIMNIGNILYVIVATVGGIFLLNGVNDLGLRSLIGGSIGLLTLDVVIPFLNMTKQFTGNVNTVSQQINSIVMALAGASRIFSLMDEEPETDDGYVTLVDAEIDEAGNITEADHHTGRWA